MNSFENSPTLIDPDTNEPVRLTHFTREEGGDWVLIEERQRGEEFFAVKFENGAIWDGIAGWR